MSKLQAAMAEWRAAWVVPVCGMLGFTGSSIWAVGQGVLLEPVTQELGLSRSEFSSAFLIYSLVALVAFPLGGRLVDRLGPRRVALAGIPLTVIGLFLFGYAQGPLWVWLLYAVLVTFFTALIALPTWVSAITSRFDASRGMALAMAISGVGVATAVVPKATALLLEDVGWRLALGYVSVGWAAIMLPLVFFGFFGRSDLERLGKIAKSDLVAAKLTDIADKASFWRDLLSREFLLVAGAGGLFASVSIGLTFNLVPILQARDYGLQEAASLAGIVGIFSILGRLGTGILLDTLPSRPVAIAVFMLPVVVAALLLAGGTQTAVIMLAIAVLGLASGSEADIVTYIASRRLKRATFASLYGVLTGLFAVGASMGPLLGSAVYDRTGSYDGYFYLAMGLLVASTICIWFVTGRRDDIAPTD